MKEAGRNSNRRASACRASWAGSTSLLLFLLQPSRRRRFRCGRERPFLRRLRCPRRVLRGCKRLSRDRLFLRRRRPLAALVHRPCLLPAEAGRNVPRHLRLVDQRCDVQDASRIALQRLKRLATLGCHSVYSRYWDCSCSYAHE